MHPIVPGIIIEGGSPGRVVGTEHIIVSGTRIESRSARTPVHEVCRAVSAVQGRGTAPDNGKQRIAASCRKGYVAGARHVDLHLAIFEYNAIGQTRNNAPGRELLIVL